MHDLAWNDEEDVVRLTYTASPFAALQEVKETDSILNDDELASER